MNSILFKLIPLKSVLEGRFFILPLLCFGLGALFHLSFAPYRIEWIAPLVIGLFFSLLTMNSLSHRRHFILGLSFGFGIFSLGLRWVHVSIDSFGGLPLIVSIILVLLLALYLALFPAFCCYLFSRFKKPQSSLFNPILFSSLWVITELARGKLLTGFPWLWLGYSQTEGVMSQNAATIGVIGLSLLICAIATLTSSVLINRRLKPLGGLVAVVLIAVTLNQINRITTTQQQVNVALVQGNIEQSAKWQADKMWPAITQYMDLTRDNFDADLIFWPEAAMPAIENWVTDYLRLMNKTANFRDSAIITGIIARQSENGSFSPTETGYFNALITLGNRDKKIQKDGDYQPNHRNRYYKHQLLPIGEFVPFEDLLRPIAPLFNLPMSSFKRGDWQQPNLQALGYKIAPAICYEIAFPELVRANMRPDTDLLLTVSNDAWFGHSIGPHQHMEIAQMRAIELGRPLLRVTNNGITAVVNPSGQIIKQLPQFEVGVLRADITLVKGQTYFYRFGQWPVIFFVSLMLALALMIKVKPA